jgi:NAD(P)H-hydrate epimerase
VDAIFGIGLSRNITGAFATLLDAMNEKAAWRVAVDIASGIDAESGAVLGSAFCADDTITFAYGKVGQYLWPGSDFSGRISVVPMGITKASWLDKKPRLAVLEESDLSWLPARSDHTNKGSYGRLLIIAGSVNMAGAAVLAAKAAYRTGCGLVKVITPEENRTIVQTAVPEALFATYGLEFDEEQVIEELKWADAVVLGPGIGTDRQAQRIVDLTLHHCEVPLLVDADALNLIAQTPALLSEPHTDMIVTPHLGEMARLTGDTVALLQSRLIESARNFAQTYDVICVLKDFRTVTSEPYGLDYLNLSGNHGMATAGSGDVLSGVIGSLLAQGMRPEKAAPLGVYLHGLAGDAAVQTCTRRALMASDIIEGLRGILS